MFSSVLVESLGIAENSICDPFDKIKPTRTLGLWAGKVEWVLVLPNIL
jgi:hypothetical protein